METESPASIIEKYQKYRGIEFRIVKIESIERPKYLIKDLEGNLLDDANGFGFNSFEAALRSWRFKTQKLENYIKKEESFKIINIWLKEHPDFMDIIDFKIFVAKKRNINLDITVKSLRSWFRLGEYDVKNLPFALKDFKTFISREISKASRKRKKFFLFSENIL